MIAALRAPGGEVVAPLAAPTGTPTVWARRSPRAGASPLGARNAPGPTTVGSPEAPSAEGSGGGAPRSGAGVPAGAPNLDTKAIPLSPDLPRTVLFHAVPLKQAAWKRATALRLIALAQAVLPHGKLRRSWKLKARDFELCGRRVGALACGACGAPHRASGTLIASCGLRICNVCARRRANTLRAELLHAFSLGDRPREMSLYFITFTLRYDPGSEDDLSIDGLRRRRQTVLDGVRYVWRIYLQRRARAAVRAIEVSPRGAVHIHMLFHGRRPDIHVVRAAWMLKVGDSPEVNVRYVKQPHKAILEIAKYVTKGASPARAELLAGKVGEFADPELAARVELAFAGNRLVECLGAWRGIDPEKDDDDSEHFVGEPCTRCGVVGDWRPVAMWVDEWLALVGTGWKMRIGRFGPRASPPLPPSLDAATDHPITQGDAP